MQRPPDLEAAAAAHERSTCHPKSVTCLAISCAAQHYYTILLHVVAQCFFLLHLLHSLCITGCMLQHPLRCLRIFFMFCSSLTVPVALTAMPSTHS